METPTPKSETQASERLEKIPSPPPMLATETPKAEIDEQPKSPAIKTEQVLDTEAELAKLESEFGKVGRDYSAEEIGDWEFDELERELRAGDSATSK